MCTWFPLLVPALMGKGDDNDNKNGYLQLGSFSTFLARNVIINFSKFSQLKFRLCLVMQGKKIERSKCNPFI